MFTLKNALWLYKILCYNEKRNAVYWEVLWKCFYIFFNLVCIQKQIINTFMHNMSENGNVQMTRRYEIIINSHDKIPKSDASKKRKKGNLIFKILIQNCFKALWHCTIKVVHMYLLIKLKVNLEVHLHRFFCNIFCDCAI